MPWNPEMTATSPRSKPAPRLSDGMPEMRAEPWAGGGLDGHLPALPGPGRDAEAVEDDGEEAGRDLLAGGDHGVVLALVEQRVGVARTRRRARWSCRPWRRPPRRRRSPAPTSRFTWAATFLMRSTEATEVPPNFITRRGRERPGMRRRGSRSCARGASNILRLAAHQTSCASRRIQHPRTPARMKRRPEWPAANLAGLSGKERMWQGCPAAGPVRKPSAAPTGPRRLDRAWRRSARPRTQPGCRRGGWRTRR